MTVDSVTIDLDSAAEADDVASVLRALTTDGPFAVSYVDRDGDRHRCGFRLKRDDLVVGYRSVIDLQMRIDREFVIIGVERHSLVASTPVERVA